MTQRRLRVLEQWNSFSGAVMPKDAPALQRTEMKRAFYAGAEGVLRAMADALTTADGMREIDAELNDFSASVKAGRN